MEIVFGAGAGIAGPRPDENAPQYDAYVPVYQPQNTLFVEPTPTPVPIYVYCNDGGQYYHTAKCATRRITPKVMLSQAVSAGLSAAAAQAAGCGAGRRFPRPGRGRRAHARKVSRIDCAPARMTGWIGHPFRSRARARTAIKDDRPSRGGQGAR